MSRILTTVVILGCLALGTGCRQPACPPDDETCVDEVNTAEEQEASAEGASGPCLILGRMVLGFGCQKLAASLTASPRAEVTVEAEEEEVVAEVAPASQSAIVGTVTDAETGQPAEGVEVVVDDFGRMRTDARGRYAFVGLTAAEYTVTMNLEGEGRTAQGPVFVVVDGQKSVSVDLAYYSRTEPPPVVPPSDLPPAGAPPGSGPLVGAALGIALTLLGGALRLWSTRRSKIR